MTILNRKEIESLIEQDYTFLINHSGGKDSDAMLEELSKIVPKSKMIAIHADLGEMEWCPETTGTISSGDWAKKQCDALGVPFHVVKSPHTLIELIRKYKRFPGAGERFCTSELKTRPINNWIKESGLTKIVNCLGLRGEESPQRAKGINKKYFEQTGIAVSLEINKGLTPKKGGRIVYQYTPIVNHTEIQVKKIIADAGRELHPAYTKFGMSRLSCVFCFLAKKSDLLAGRKAAPELFDKIEALEPEIEKTIFIRKTQKNKVKTIHKMPLSEYLDRPYKPRTNTKKFNPFPNMALLREIVA